MNLDRHVASVLGSAEKVIATLPADSPMREHIRTLARWRALFVCLRKVRPWCVPATVAVLRDYCKSNGLSEHVAELLIADELPPSSDGLSAAPPNAPPTEDSPEGPQQKRQSVPNNGRKD